jgi:hypothetical protein
MLPAVGAALSVIATMFPPFRCADVPPVTVLGRPDIPRISGPLSLMFCFIEARRNEIRSVRFAQSWLPGSPDHQFTRRTRRDGS